MSRGNHRSEDFWSPRKWRRVKNRHSRLFCVLFAGGIEFLLERTRLPPPRKGHLNLIIDIFYDLLQPSRKRLVKTLFAFQPLHAIAQFLHFVHHRRQCL
jgi:hypothetical protein